MMIKKVLYILLTVLLILIFSGCTNEQILNNESSSTETIECNLCGFSNDIDNNFCTACGCGLKPFFEENMNDETYENKTQYYNILSYFNSYSEKSLIIYECDIAKDARVRNAYVVKNGQCRLYYCDTTLGELSKMTDEEIINMLEDNYQKGLNEALSIWTKHYSTKDAILEGKIKLYNPRSYDITSCLFTDDTGNNVVGELLFFPQAGIDGNPYVIEHLQHSESDLNFLNCYGSDVDNDSYRDIKFKVEYFNTGHGLKSDANTINNIYYLSRNSMTSGTVYNSNYYGLRSTRNEWADKDETLCFRIDNNTNINLKLDIPSSENVNYIDPTNENILQIANTYYSLYYSSFEKLKD